MTDFFDIKNELKKLRPIPPNEKLWTRIEKELLEPEVETETPPNVIRPDRFRFNWAIGLGLAAAAMLFLLARLNLAPIKGTDRVAAHSPAPLVQSPAPAPSLRDAFIPSGATQVVYHKRDEGLIFPRSSSEPVRRVRSHTRETLQWNNPATGASLRVSYPSEQVELIPVSGQ